MDNLFGMGLLLEVRDYASDRLRSISRLFNQAYSSAEEFNRGVDGVSNKLSQLAMTSSSLLYGGKQLISMGQGITGVFKQVASQVITTGSQFENYRKTLKALYKDQDLATSKANWAMDLASTTPFEVQDVMSALIGFKAVGVEADTQFQSVNGEMRTFLEYVGDLAALRPDVGMQGVLMGIRNMMGGDGGKSLRMRMDIDPEQILGRKLSKTSEGMMKDVVDLSQALASNLMKELEGTWDQLVSNLKDQQTRFMLAIGDAGAFDSVKKSLQRIFDVINAIDSDEMAKIGESVANIFSELWKPVDWVAEKVAKLITYLKDLVQTNPLLFETIAKVTMMTAGLLTLTGVLAVVGGIIGFVKYGIGNLTLALNVFSNRLGITRNGLFSLSSILTTLATKLIPIIALSTLFYTVWTTDFAGIKTFTLQGINGIVNAFNNARTILGQDTDSMINSIRGLRESDSIFDSMTLGIITVVTFLQVLADAWGDLTLSDDNFRKAQELGILPLIEAILDFKLISSEVWRGFKEGFTLVGDIAREVVLTVVDWIDTAVEKFKDFCVSMGWISEEEAKTKESFKEAINLDAWFDVGKIAGIIAGIGTIVLIGSKVFGVVMGIIGIVSKAFAFVGTVISGIGSFISAVAGPIGVALTAIAGFLGLPVWAVVAIGVAIAGLVAVVIAYWDEIKTATINLCSAIGQAFVDFWTNVLEPLVHFISDVFVSAFTVSMEFVGGIVDHFAYTVGEIFNGVKLIFSGVIDFITGVFTGNWEKAWTGVVNIFKGIFSTLEAVAKAPLNGIISMINGVINGLNKISISIPDWGWIPDGMQGKEFGVNIPNIPKLNTGGYVKSEGISMLHPNEVVINDPLTQRLKEFLTINERARQDSVLPVYPVANNSPEIVAGGSSSDKVVVTKNSIIAPKTSDPKTPKTDTQGSEEVNFTIEKGAIVINLEKGDEQDAENLVNKVLEKFKKQQKLRKILAYN